MKVRYISLSMKTAVIISQIIPNVHVLALVHFHYMLFLLLFRLLHILDNVHQFFLIYFSKTSFYRYLYGTEMVRNVITIQMEGIETEQNVGVRTAAVNLLVHIAITQKSSVVPDILNMLEKVSTFFTVLMLCYKCNRFYCSCFH